MRKFYPAIIGTDAGRTAFDITFPDFPDCVCAGRTPQEAMEMAPAALAGHIAAMAGDGAPIPDPSSLEEATGDDGDNVVLVTLVAAPPVAKRSRRINITMDGGLLEEIDSVAANRSGFLADAARAELARRRAER